MKTENERLGDFIAKIAEREKLLHQEAAEKRENMQTAIVFGKKLINVPHKRLNGIER